MTWWDAVKNWYAGKREEPFPTPSPETPDREVKYTGAADWLSKRANLTTVMGSKELAAEWTEKARAQAFFSARVAEGHILDRLRKVSDAFSRGEIGQAEARTELKKFLLREGYDPKQAGLRNLASTARLDLILEQNARMAAAVGQYQAGMDPDIKERFPCWRYIGSTALVPRDTHARFAGKVFRKDDPIWHKIFPPSDFNCKCSVEDCDDEPDEAPQDVESAESGFAFDPEHAFEEFDLSTISDNTLRKKTEEELNELRRQQEERRKAEAIRVATENTAKKREDLERLLEEKGIDATETQEAERLLKLAIQEEARANGTEIPDFKPKTKKKILAELNKSAELARLKYEEEKSENNKAALKQAEDALTQARKMSAADVKAKFDKSPLQTAIEAVEARKKDAVLAATDFVSLQSDALKSVYSEKFSDIWKDPVSVFDYPEKKGKIQAKRDYFEAMLKSKPEQEGKFRKLLDDLADFEKRGREYEEKLEEIQNILTRAQHELNEFRVKNHLQEDMYTQAKKDAAYWFKRPLLADDVLRERCGELWRNATDAEKESAYEYTSGSGKFNRPLSGFSGGDWSPSGYKGPGNVDINAEGAGSMIRNLTNMISRSTYDFDIWTQRGCDAVAISGPFKCGNLLKMSEKDLQKVVGKAAVINAFVSTSPVKNCGFSGEVIMNIFVPRGTQAMYCEPFSHYGNGAGRHWNGVSKQKKFGNEFELLLQRGATYKITKIERSNGVIFMDLEIHPEMGYITFQQEEGGKNEK